MSYVSGFMMGAAIGKSIRQMVAGGGAPKMGGTAAMPLRKVQRTVLLGITHLVRSIRRMAQKTSFRST